MEVMKTRWATSEGVYLFQVPEISTILDDEVIMLLSSSIYAINVFFDKEQIQFSNEKLSIVRINFHPPHMSEENQNDNDTGYIIHGSFNQGIGLQSIFYSDSLDNQRSEFEKAFLDSIASNLQEKLAEQGRNSSDLLFLRGRATIDEIEVMLQEIDSNYSSLVMSWSLAQGPDYKSRFIFDKILYNGKIKVEELFYDLGERAIESFNSLMMSKEEKIVLYKIAKGLVSLSGLIYEDQVKAKNDQLNFIQSEIILEANHTKTLFRLDVRSYDINGEGFCDITISSN